ncbi:glycosyltransferase family 71 protein [Parathielavia hyrcaniae]|uniref:Glycosyltransferase family 71 protein n=1 Tax=Parathielavia hyrcaniae TaxID=113614 RepID=A0AAN6Q9H6_9PEZI|nr:glycosyltransferase family 71 protein [Parathielavia hyrcaniae]
MLRRFLFGGKPRGRASVLVLSLLTALLYLTVRSRLDDNDDLAPYTPYHVPSNTYNISSDWWVEFFMRLETTRVTATPTEINGSAPNDNWTPNTSVVRADLLLLNTTDEAKFRESHASFVRQLPQFASHIPYDAGTTGIVSTAGARNFGQAISMVLMTRQAGSRLPIQIVVDSNSPWVDLVCAETLPRYDASCLFLEDMWASLHHEIVPKLHRFQWKFISIIASSFQNVLFLDADTLPVRSPDHLFTREPFISAGFITWPDYWVSQVAPAFYKIAGDVEVPSIASRASSESGIIMYDKARHADTLLLAAYYNYNGPDHYYSMLNQHGPGEGDKETFFQAALVLDGLRKKGAYQPPTAWMKPGVGVKKGYWDVKAMPKSHGRTAKGLWRGMFMQQMDPSEDYRAVMAAIEKAKNDEVHDKANDESKSNPAAKARGTTAQPPLPPPPTPPRRRRQQNFSKAGQKKSGVKQRQADHKPGTKPKQEDGGQEGEETSPPPNDADSARTSNFLTDSTFLDTAGRLPLQPDAHHYMFFHHNGVKPDLTGVLDEGAEILATDEEGRYVRMWGDPGWIIERYGRDVERVLWHDSIEVYCQERLAGRFQRLRKVCRKMRETYERVHHSY